MPLYIPILITVIVCFMVFLNMAIHRLQKIKNTTARIVTSTYRFTQITPILKPLHWLPILCRINFKICSLIYRVISLGEPYYLRSLLSNRLNSHSLRSSSFNPLVVPCFKKVCNSICSFSYAASFLWNHLPNAIRSAPTYMSFRKNLKTEYYKVSIKRYRVLIECFIRSQLNKYA